MAAILTSIFWDACKNFIADMQVLHYHTDRTPGCAFTAKYPGLAGIPCIAVPRDANRTNQIRYKLFSARGKTCHSQCCEERSLTNHSVFSLHRCCQVCVNTHGVCLAVSILFCITHSMICAHL